jgi:hypothetical protein
MAKAPQRPEEIFQPLTADYRAAFGEGLESIILYGSGAGEAYTAGRSDLIFLLVLTEDAMDRLVKAVDAVARWKKQRVAVPLVMTRDYIRSSLDVYPIEFLDMKLQHILVYGEDVLEGMAFAPDNLRLQLERELKGKLLHLRQGYLDVEGKGTALRELLRVSLPAVLSAFKALLVLREERCPGPVRTHCGCLRAYGIDRAVFAQCLAVREAATVWPTRPCRSCLAPIPGYRAALRKDRSISTTLGGLCMSKGKMVLIGVVVAFCCWPCRFTVSSRGPTTGSSPWTRGEKRLGPGGEPAPAPL